MSMERVRSASNWSTAAPVSHTAMASRRRRGTASDLSLRPAQSHARPAALSQLRRIPCGRRDRIGDTARGRADGDRGRAGGGANAQGRRGRAPALSRTRPAAVRIRCFAGGTALCRLRFGEPGGSKGSDICDADSAMAERFVIVPSVAGLVIAAGGRTQRPSHRCRAADARAGVSQIVNALLRETQLPRRRRTGYFNSCTP